MGEQVLAGTLLLCLTAWAALTLGVAAFGLFLVHLAARHSPAAPRRPPML